MWLRCCWIWSGVILHWNVSQKKPPVCLLKYLICSYTSTARLECPVWQMSHRGHVLLWASNPRFLCCSHSSWCCLPCDKLFDGSNTIMTVRAGGAEGVEGCWACLLALLQSRHIVSQCSSEMTLEQECWKTSSTRALLSGSWFMTSH